MNHNLIPNPEFLKSMPLKDRKAWSMALLSGDFAQGRRYRNRDDKSCCLGVYCHMKGISMKYDGVAFPRYTDLSSEDPIFATRSSGAAYIALAYSSVFGKQPISAVEVNDSLELSFAEIAALIYPEGENQ